MGSIKARASLSRAGGRAARSFRDAALRLAESVAAAYRAEAAALDGVAPPPYYA